MSDHMHVFESECGHRLARLRRGLPNSLGCRISCAGCSLRVPPGIEPREEEGLDRLGGLGLLDELVHTLLPLGVVRESKGKHRHAVDLFGVVAVDFLFDSICLKQGDVVVVGGSASLCPVSGATDLCSTGAYGKSGLRRWPPTTPWSSWLGVRFDDGLKGGAVCRAPPLPATTTQRARA